MVVRDVAGGIRVDGIDRPPLAVRIGNDNQAVLKHGRRNWYVTAALEAPQFLAGFQVVSTDVLPSVHHDLPPLGPTRGIGHYGG
jgi:hypothetical protein